MHARKNLILENKSNRKARKYVNNECQFFYILLQNTYWHTYDIFVAHRKKDRILTECRMAKVIYFHYAYATH